MLLQGSIWGDRIVSWRGELSFKDLKNNLMYDVCHYVLHTYYCHHFMLLCISLLLPDKSLLDDHSSNNYSVVCRRCELQVNPNALNKGWFSRSSNAYRMDAVVGKLHVNDAESISVSGSWLGELRFDNVPYFNALSDASAFEQARACPHPRLLLPSDARFRSDLCALKGNDLPEAARCKLQLEQLQRADRRLRAEGAAR